MLQVQSLTKAFGRQALFEDVSFSLGERRRAGLVGPNGSGKSTLLRILAGLDSADGGRVRMASGMRVGYLPQRQEAHPDLTVEDVLGAEPWRVRRAMARAGLDPDLSGRRLDQLSGGERTRVHLARVALLEDADLLLLDEPTNNLDLGALRWLEDYLEGLNAALLVVSHDRRFLDRITDRTLVLDPLTRSLADYGGNYSWYLRRRQEDQDRQWREYRAHQDVVRRLEADVRATKQQALATENRTVNDFLRGKSKKVAAKAKARETRLRKLQGEENRVEKPRDLERMRLAIASRDLHGAVLVEAAGLAFGGIVSRVDVALRAAERVVVLGNNGSGKTTLVRLLLGLLEPASGRVRRRSDLEIGYLPQLQETLPEHDTVLSYFHGILPRHRAMDEGAARTFLHRFLFSGADAYKRIGSLSSGERARLLLAGVMARGADLLVLDEPTNHLDAPTLERLEDALEDFGGALLVVTHDRGFAEAVCPHQIWDVGGGKVTVTWAS